MGTATTIRKGQRYRTRAPMEILYTTQWYAPFTGGGRGVLPAGTVFVVEHDPPPAARAAACLPENGKEIEALLIPEEDRRSKKYGGFTLVMDLEVIGGQCDAVEQGVEPDGR
jgi:hypothetical protein